MLLENASTFPSNGVLLYLGLTLSSRLPLQTLLCRSPESCVAGEKSKAVQVLFPL